LFAQLGREVKFLSEKVGGITDFIPRGFDMVRGKMGILEDENKYLRTELFRTTAECEDRYERLEQKHEKLEEKYKKMEEKMKKMEVMEEKLQKMEEKYGNMLEKVKKNEEWIEGVKKL
jgi:flagellar capping protein FliD